MAAMAGGLIVQSRNVTIIDSGITKEFRESNDDDVIAQRSPPAIETVDTLPSSSSSLADDTNDAVATAERHRKMRRELADRDEMWRRHERAQIAFLQAEHAHMLHALHAEIERLHNTIRGLELNRCPSSSSSDLLKNEPGEGETRARLAHAEHRVRDLTTQLDERDERVRTLEAHMDKSMRVFRDQLSFQAERIRQLTRELHDKTTAFTQLSTQLRAVKLREAMAVAAQRRRASSETSPNRSPSAFRLFSPPALPRSATVTTSPRPGNAGGLRHASVTVSYPSSKANSYGEGGLTSVRPSSSSSLIPPIRDSFSSSSGYNNIEKPNRIVRSSSATNASRASLRRPPVQHQSPP